MDSVYEAPKIQDTNIVDKKSHHNNLMSLTNSFASLLCVLLFSYTFFPYTSIKNTCIMSSLFKPKCLFLVVNVIVAFLVGESKFKNLSNSSQVKNFFNEYVTKARNFTENFSEFISQTEDGENHENVVIEKNIIHVEGHESEVAIEIEEEGGLEQERGLPVEELNKRAEELIAKVNKQWLESN